MLQIACISTMGLSMHYLLSLAYCRGASTVIPLLHKSVKNFYWRLGRVYGGIARRNAMDTTDDTLVVSPSATASATDKFYWNQTPSLVCTQHLLRVSHYYYIICKQKLGYLKHTTIRKHAVIFIS